MTVEQNHDAYDTGEALSWAWPVYAFVAWFASILDYLARFQRIRHTQRFKSNWRDNWDGLRESEWHRDQLIAQGVAQLLAGQPLQLDDTKIQLTPPASYGGPCPRTPFDMNRRFIALAKWAADPEAIIRERFRRVSRNLLAAHGSTDALRAAHHELGSLAGASSRASQFALMLSRPQNGRPLTLRSRRQAASRRAKHERGLTYARGPPIIPNYRCPLPTAPKAPASGIASPCLKHRRAAVRAHD
jgi:hypothetical protein